MNPNSRYWIFGILCLITACSCRGGVKRVDTEQKIIALTFDDGPNSPYTDQLLETLNTKKVHATFFLIGKQVEAYPELAKKIKAEGHEIGGHSYDWESLVFKKRNSLNAELDQMDAAFCSVGITNVSLFRPPGGLLTPGQDKILMERGLKHISADVVVGDWKSVDSEKICARVLKRLRPGSIIVLHDGGGDRSETIKAVSAIIDELTMAGYSFATVSELLDLH